MNTKNKFNDVYKKKHNFKDFGDDPLVNWHKESEEESTELDFEKSLIIQNNNSLEWFSLETEDLYEDFE